jgi:predicted metal-dependent phosphotriesterase family hydrolase
VTGEIPAASLGFTQGHEHVLVDLSRAAGRWDYEGVLLDREVAANELTLYRQTGGDSIVEMTTSDLGRDPVGLREVSMASQVHIVMGCGWYREPYYPPEIDTSTSVELSDVLMSEIASGVQETGIKPGVIGEIGTDKLWMSAQEERVFRAAAIAQSRTGLGLMTHTPPGAAPLHLAVLKAGGADLRRVAVGHADALMSLDYHEAISNTGAMLSFDLVGQAVYPDEWRVRHLVELRDRGLLSRVMLSQDMCHRSRLRAWGGHGYSYLQNRFLPMLIAAGLTSDDVLGLMTRNPQRFPAGQ